MLTGERRGGSARRGMTVLGKIPAVPKPINLPSQRLENRGLDPNVEIVPRGSVSWGTAGRSPPTSSSAWGNTTPSSSPPVGGGPWGSSNKSGPPPPSGGPWGSNFSRPSSAGSGTRPSSAGSIGQTHEALAAANAWGPATARPASASGVLGQAESQPPVPRPRSAETRTLNGQAPALTRFADHGNGPAWGGAGTARKVSEDSQSLHQPARFTLTRVDFPTLGSEKNPDLRPQQNKSERPGSADGKIPSVEERPPQGPGGHYEELPPGVGGGYGGQERMAEGWRREGVPYGGHPGMAEGNWHRDGPHPMQQYGGGPHPPDTWRREPGHGAAPGAGPSDDNWRRGGPPVGPYGPPGPGRFPQDPSGFMHQQRFGPGPGPGPYGRGGGPGPGGYGRHGEMYSNSGPFARAGGAGPPRPGPPMGPVPGMYQGPVPYDNYYGPPGVPGPGFGNMDEREMIMLGMGGGPPGMYGNFPQGPPGDHYSRYPHGGPGPGPRHMANNTGGMRDRGDVMGYEGEGFREGPKYKENPNFKEGHKDGSGFGKEGPPYKDGGRPTLYADASEGRRVGHVMRTGSGNSGPVSDMQRHPSSRGGSHHPGHRDWGAAASSDEPMDFSKPVFEEDVSSASPVALSKQSSTVSRGETDTSQLGDDSKGVENWKPQEAPQEADVSEKFKPRLPIGEVKDGPVQHASNSGNVNKTESGQPWRHGHVDLESQILKSKVPDRINLDTKDQVVKKGVPLEDSDASDRRLGKDGITAAPTFRDRNMGREHIFSPHGGRAGLTKKESIVSNASVTAASATRSGLVAGVSSGGSNKSSTVSVPRVSSSSSALEPADSDEVLYPLEKHGSIPSSPSGSDGQRNSEKLRILKRLGDGLESPQSDIVNMNENSSSEVAAAGSAVIELPLKEDMKPKSKPASGHDGEKEWRPKVPIVETSEVSRAPVGKLPSSSTILAGSVSAAVTDPPEKGGPDSENVNHSDSYDSDAQRARRKELAAQKARQLRKEEEERIKEQRAKALVKLEELNRRSSGSSGPLPSGSPVLEEGPKESLLVVTPLEESGNSLSEVVIQEIPMTESTNGGTGIGTPRSGVRNGRNEHGKRERVGDRKNSGRGREEHRAKLLPEEQREGLKGRLSSSLSQTKLEPPLLPSPPQEASPRQVGLPSPSFGQISHQEQSEKQEALPPESTSAQVIQLQQVPHKPQDGRHRWKQYVPQQKQVGRQSQPSAEVDQVVVAQETMLAADTSFKGSAWSMGSSAPLDLDPKEVTLSLGPDNVSNEVGTAAFRKKKSKSSGRNKQKLEIVTSSADSTPSVEPNQGWTGLQSVCDPTFEVGKSEPQSGILVGGDDDMKVVPLPVFQRDSVSQDPRSEVGAGEQLKDPGIESGGSDVGSLRSNGDPPNKKVQRKSQPGKRVVRDKGTSQDVRIADKPHSGEGMVWAPVRSPSGGHPNGPKGGFGGETPLGIETPPERKEEPPVVQQTGRARRAELERYTPKPAVKQQAQQQEEMQQQLAAPSLPQHQAIDSSNIAAPEEVPQISSSLNDIKFGSETRQAETMGKHGRAHTSWRQRGSGSERGSGPKDAHQVQHLDSLDTSAKLQQPTGINQSQQSHQRNRPVSNVSSEQSRSGNSQHSRPVIGPVNRQQSSLLPTEKDQQNHQGRSVHANTSNPVAAPLERDHKSSQESGTPYQPPRPASTHSSRGVENEFQSSHEPSRSHRVNTVQMDRQVGLSGKYDRDSHSSQERPASHHQTRHNPRHQAPLNSHDREHLHAHSGPHNQPRNTQMITSEGAQMVREKDLKTGQSHGPVQTRSTPQSVHVQHPVTGPSGMEHSPPKQGTVQQLPRSPGRQRTRQQSVGHEREQNAPVVHPHQHSRYRQPGNERELHREVTNAVNHQPRGGPDGQWQQTGVIHDRNLSNTDSSQPHPHLTRAASVKAQTSVSSTEQDLAPSHAVSNQLSRPESSNLKTHMPATGDSQKHPHYQPVSQPSSQLQKPLQQALPQSAKADNVHSVSHWNGERGSSPTAPRVREHGHSRRGRFGSRSTGVGGRSLEVENRRDHQSKQRVVIDTGAGAVPSQVGG